MATHTIPAGAIGSPAFALEAGQVSTVTFNGPVASMEVVSDGVAAVWWTYDGTTPSTSGVGYYIPMAGVDERSTPRSARDDDTTTVVKLISTGTPVVRVQRG